MLKYQKHSSTREAPEFDRFDPEEYAGPPRPVKNMGAVERLIYTKNKVVEDTIFTHFLRQMLAHQWVQARPMPTPPRDIAMGGHRGPAAAAPADRSFQKLGEIDWAKHLFDGDVPIRRVNAYTFRGDSRPISALRKAGGFASHHCRDDDEWLVLVAKRFSKHVLARYGKTVDPVTAFGYLKNKGKMGREFVRYFQVWRAVQARLAGNLMQHVDSADRSAYVSTSRSIGVAEHFASQPTRSAAEPYVYVVRVRGGFSLSGRHAFNHTKESEVAVHGTIPFKDVYGFRRWGDQGLTGEVFLKKGFREKDAAACDEVMKLLSGFPQEQTGQVN
jgi:hypothetical protein